MKSKIIWGLFICIGIMMLIQKIESIRGNIAEDVKPEDERKARIERQFSKWDGSHYNMERHIKSLMNDPDSYKHIETRYSDEGDYLIVGTKFSGTNAFGGRVTNYISAKISLDGRIIEILQK